MTDHREITNGYTSNPDNSTDRMHPELVKVASPEFVSLAESENIACCLFEMDGEDIATAVVTYCSPAYVELTGHSMESILGEQPDFLTDTCTRKAAKQAISDSISEPNVEFSYFGKKPCRAPFRRKIRLTRQTNAADTRVQTFLARATEGNLNRSEQEEVLRLFASANSLVWSARVKQYGDAFDWKFRFLNMDESVSWIPLEIREGQSQTEAWANAIGPQQYSEMDRRSGDAFNNGESGYLQSFVIRLADNSERRISESVNISLIGPKEWDVIGVCTDITQHYEMHQQLRAERNLLRNLIDHFPDQIYVKDVDRRFVLYNSNSASEYTQEQVLGNRDEDIFSPELAAEYRAVDEQVIRGEIEEANERQLVVDEFGHKTLYHSLKFPLRDPDGAICGLIGIKRDISEVEAASETLMQTVKSARCMVWDAIVEITESGQAAWDLRFIHDDAGKLLWPVPQAPEVPFSIAWTEARLPEDRQECYSRCMTAMLTGQTSLSQQFRIRLNDGSLRWLNEDIRIEQLSDSRLHLVGVCIDITEHKEVEQALQHERNLLRTLIDGLPDAVHVKDKNGRYVVSNPTYLTALDLPADFDVIGKTTAEVHDPENASRFAKDDEYVMSTGLPLLIEEHAITSKDGRVHWFRTDKVPLRDRDGKVDGLIGVSRDITLQRESAAHMSRTMTTARCMLWHAEICGQLRGAHTWNLVMANEDAGQLLWPISVEGFSRYSDAWCAAKVEQDLRPSVELLLCTLETDGSAYDQEFRIRLKDGSIRWIAEHVQVERLNSELWRLVGVCIDVTETKAAEKNLRDAMTWARCLVWNANVELRDGKFDWSVTVSNEDAALRWLRLQIRESQTFYQAWGDARHPDDRLPCAKAISDRLLSGAEGAVIEFRILLPDGSTRWIVEDIQIEPRSHNKWQLVGVCTDITERKLLELEQDKNLKQALEKADRDPLTGLLNHRAFHARLTIETDRALREDGSLGVAMIDLDNFKFFNDAYGHLVGDTVLKEISYCLTGCCRPYDTVARFGGDEFAVLLPGITPDEARSLSDRIKANLKQLRFCPPGATHAIPLSLTVGLAVFPDDGLNRLDVLRIADERMMRIKSGIVTDDLSIEELRIDMMSSVSGFDMLSALVTAVDNKDRYTRRHSDDVLKYCVQIANELNVTEGLIREIKVAALLHDVGKIGVPDTVLRKPGALTADEFAAIRQHPEMGAIIVGAVPELQYTLDAVRHHHERWDGTGYPDGLARQDIPLTARIMAVADAYSAMTTDRPYRMGMPSEVACDVLSKGAGTQWDPHCVAAFLSARKVVTA